MKRIRYIKIYVLVFFAILLHSASIYATPTEDGKIYTTFLALIDDTSAHDAAKPSEDEIINPVEIIFEHLQDTYWWHITTINEKHISIYLPVIVRSSTTGWHVFSSSHLEHNHTYEGFFIATEGDNAGKIVELNSAGQEVKPIDLSLTKIALGLIINSILMLVIFISVANWYKKNNKNAVPNGFVGAMEMFIMSIEDDIIRKSIGSKYKKYSPYLLTAFFFIFINNIMGQIPVFPGGANTTGNIAITFTLAICSLVAINLFANKEYWKEIFWPDVPVWLKCPIPLMQLIELFGVLSKPFSLMIRLFANIMAGHSIVISLTCMIFITVKLGAGMHAGMTVFSILLSVFIGLLEILVAYIQAYVFTMLSAVFIGLSVAEHHGGSGKPAKERH